MTAFAYTLRRLVLIIRKMQETGHGVHIREHAAVSGYKTHGLHRRDSLRNWGY